MNRPNKNLEGHDGAYLQADVPQRTNIRKENPPHNVTIRWGWTESIISRRTAKLIQESEFIDLLREWVQDIFFPEEFFYATLATINRNELAKGKVVQGKSLN